MVVYGQHTKGEFKKGELRTLKASKKGMQARLQKYPNLQSEAGRNSRKYENMVASKLKGDYIFMPNEICDRIVVRNGAIFFVEIKRKGEKLRPKQELFKSIVKEKYEIVTENLLNQKRMGDKYVEMDTCSRNNSY